MTRMQLFKEMYEMSCHNLLCYSESYLLDKPKVGYTKQWKKENEKIELLKELIEEEKNREKNCKYKQILNEYPDIQYFIKNSNGGLLAGTFRLEDAKKSAEEYKKEYLKDTLNNKLNIYVCDKQGNNIYVAEGKKSCIKNEETEELE